MHEYLGMNLDYRKEGKVKIDMTNNLKKILDDLQKKSRKGQHTGSKPYSCLCHSLRGAPQKILSRPSMFTTRYGKGHLEGGESEPSKADKSPHIIPVYDPYKRLILTDEGRIRPGILTNWGDTLQKLSQGYKTFGILYNNHG